MDTICSFYWTLVRHTPAGQLEPAVQREIVRWSQTHQHTELQVLLLGRDDVDPDVEAELGQSTDLDVLVAWASQDSRTPDQLRARLSTEKRATALMPLAEMPNLPAEIYRTVGEHTSVKLAEALVCNFSVPLQLRADKLIKLLHHYTRSDDATVRRFSRMLGADALLHRVAAPEVRSAGVALEMVKSGHLDAAALRCLASRLDELDHVAQQPPANRSAQETYTTTHRFAALVVELAEAAPNDPQVTSPALTWALTILERTRPHHPVRPRLERLIERLDDTVVGLHTFIRQMEQTTDPHALEQLFSTARRSHCRNREDEGQLAAAVGAHPAATSTMLWEMLPRMGTAATHQLAQRLVDEDDIETLITLNYRHPLPYPGDLHHHTRDLQLAERIVREAGRQARENRDRVPGWVRTRTAGLVPEVAVAALPWADLVSAVSDRRSAQLTALVQQRLVAQLGDTPELWESFATLGTDFGGSLDELLGVVTALQ